MHSAENSKRKGSQRLAFRRAPGLTGGMTTSPEAPDGGGLTAGLARLPTRLHATGASAQALEAARRAFIDTCGVMLAGWREPATAMLAAASPDGGEAWALVGGRRLSAEHAARLNGMAGHVLDYDDVVLHGHPSVVLVPAILAEGQRLGVSGREALMAYVAGFEAWVELCGREPDTYHLSSWHPTAVLGAIAATVAVATLNRLDETIARHAIAIAASLASGVIANFGSHAKPLQAGHAAASAIEAARLARAGLTGGGAALESRHGLMIGVSPLRRVDLASPVRLPEVPEQWRLPAQGLSVKRYPVCYAAHRVIDGVVRLRQETGLQAGQVAAVTASLARAPAVTLRFDHPRTGHEARFSLQHAVAAALLDGAVGFPQLADAYVARPEVAGLYPLTRVRIVEDEPCPEQPGLALHDRVVIALHDGRRLDSGPIRYARGQARAPLSETELAAKFRDCAAHGGVCADALLSALQRLETLPSLRELTA